MREYKTRKGNKRAQLSLGFEPPGDRADRGRASAALCGAGIPVERETEMEVARTFKLGGIDIDAYLNDGVWWVRPVAVAKSLGLDPRSQRRLIDRASTGEAAYVAGFDVVGSVRPLRVLRLGDFFQWVLNMDAGRMGTEAGNRVRLVQADIRALIEGAFPPVLGLVADGLSDIPMAKRRTVKAQDWAREKPGRKWWNLFGGKSNG